MHIIPLQLKTLAEKLLDDFSYIIRITCNSFPGNGLSLITILPQKRSLNQVVHSSKTSQIDFFSFHTNISPPSDFDQFFLLTLVETDYVLNFVTRIATLDFDPLTLDEAKANSNLSHWSKALNAKYSLVP